MMTSESMSVQQQKEIRVYEADPIEQRNVELTCHDCKLTLGMMISKSRIVQYCPVCGKPAEITEDPTFVKVPLLRTIR